MSRPGQLAHGRNPGDMVRQFADRFREIDRRLREITAMATKAITAATAAGVQPKFVRSDQGSLTFGSSWVDYDMGTVTPPAGYTGLIYLTWVSAGATFTSGGSISVQPYMRDSLGDRLNGPAVANGAGSAAACSASSVIANIGSSESPSNPLTVGASVAISGSIAAASGNVHLSSLLIFTH